MEDQKHHRRLNNEARHELPTELHVVPLVDTVVEAHGFKPLHQYVEFCWTPVLGPTATLLYRRLGVIVCQTDGFNERTVTTSFLSADMGLGESTGRNSKLANAIARLTYFNAAEWRGDDLAVRRALAPLATRYVERLSPSAREAHRHFLERPKPSDELPQHRSVL